jgi:hypothetical protein
MKFYAIEYDATDWVYPNGDRDFLNCYKQVVGRCYYTSSKAKSVDPTDVQYAKLFPNERSVRAAVQYLQQTGETNTKVFEVETSVTVLGEVEL